MAEKREISDGDENLDPNVSKKRRLSLPLKKRSSYRFGGTSDEQLHSMSFYMMPKNSATSSQWAMKNLSDWREEYNRTNPDKNCPEEIMLPSCSKELLNEWLCIYITETQCFQLMHDFLVSFYSVLFIYSVL